MSYLVLFSLTNTLSAPLLAIPLFTYQDQKDQALFIQQTKLTPLSGMLDTLSSAEEDCLAANVEENDYTLLTGDDLRWELELFKGAVGKRVAFVENQVGLPFSVEDRRCHVREMLIISMCSALDRLERNDECKSSFDSFTREENSSY